MNISEIQKKIMTDDEFVLSEIRRLQYLFSLKQVIRAKQSRTENIQTESVAEHIYSMHLLARYFLPLEDPDKELDELLIHKLIIWHEIDEIESGDIVPWEKTPEDKARLNDDATLALSKMPESLASEAQQFFETYEAKQTPEARFVKAIDKLDPVIDSYTEEGKKRMHNYGITAEQNMAIKMPYINDYLYIKRFNSVIHEHFISEGFFGS